MRLGIALWISMLSLQGGSTLDFYIVDVGQGNATIVVAPSGQTMVFDAGPRRTALRRPVQDSVVAGVAAGLARYLGVDVMIIRLAFVVLTIVGGAGIPLYLAGLLLIPEEGSDQSIAGSLLESLRSRSR